MAQDSKVGIRVVSLFVCGLAALVVAGCTAEPTVPVVPGPPVIHAFSATRTTGPSPLTTTFTWSVSDPEADQLSCELDLDGDGAFEIAVAQCSNAVARSTTYDAPGTVSARLRVTDGTHTVASSPLTVTVGAPSADAFSITLRFDPSVPAAQQLVFQAAAERWAEVIRTGLSDSSLDIPANDCGTGAPAFQGNVDDVLLDATVAPIDGVDGILGQAGPCLVRTGGGLPVYGAMQFDSDDVASMVVDGTFDDVVLHEMGHVLGLGTLWDSQVTGAGTSDPRFTGMTARGALSELFGGDAQPVPVEETGGLGTAGMHWRESVFADELMTGWISPGANPLSRVTAGALADLGYGVDLGAADDLPLGALRRRAAPARELGELLIRPTGTVD